MRHFFIFFVFTTCLIQTSCMKKLEQLEEIEREESSNSVSLIALSSNDGVSLSWTPSLLPVNGYLIIREALDNKRPSKGPESGVQYAAGEKLGAGTVVYNGSTPQFTDTTTVSGTDYRYLLFSYVLSNANYNYFYLDASVVNVTGTVLTTSNTVRRPTSISVSARSGALKLTWTADGNQTGFLLVRRPNIHHVSDANVKFKPTNGVVYSVGQDLGDGEVVVYEGAELSYDDTNLLNGLQQRYSLFAYNAERVYSEPYGIFRAPLASILGEPTLVAQAGDKSVLLSWYTGGVTITSVMVLRKSATTNNEVTSVPLQGHMYSAGMTFGNQTVIYVGNGTSAIDTGLNNNTKYYYTIYLVTGNVYKLLQVKAIATPLANTISPIKHEDGTSGGSSGGANGGTNGGSSGGDSGQCAFAALSNKTPNTKTAHAGIPFPWEGKVISKNFQFGLSAGLLITFNSLDTKEDFGLGTQGLRFTVDTRLKQTSPKEITRIEGDGSESYFQRTSCSPITWESRNVLLSRSKIIERDGKLVEISYRGDTELEYTKTKANHYGLTSLKDANSNTISLVRNTSGQITSVTDSLSSQTALIDYSDGRALSVSLSCGGQYLLEYDLGKRLNKITNPDSTNIKMEYADGTNLITALTGRLGEKSQYRYNTDGSIKSIVNPYNYLTTFSYTDTEYTLLGFSNKQVETYNANGALIKTVDNEVTTQFGRDALNQLTSLTNHFGQIETYSYDSKQYLIGIKDVTGVNTGILRDARGNTTRTMTTGGGGLVNIIRTYTYDDKNRLTSATSPYGVTAYSYDSAGNVTSVTQDGQIVAKASYSNGLPTEITDNYGVKTQVQYDSQGALTSLKNIFSNITQTNNVCGQPVSVQSGGISSTYSYDQLGRVVSEAYTGPTGKSWSEETSYTVTQGQQASWSWKSKRPVKMASTSWEDSTPRGNAAILIDTTSWVDSNNKQHTESHGEGGTTRTTDNITTFNCGECKEHADPLGWE